MAMFLINDNTDLNDTLKDHIKEMNQQFIELNSATRAEYLIECKKAERKKKEVKLKPPVKPQRPRTRYSDDEDRIYQSNSKPKLWPEGPQGPSRITTHDSPPRSISQSTEMPVTRAQLEQEYWERRLDRQAKKSRHIELTAAITGIIAAILETLNAFNIIG